MTQKKYILKPGNHQFAPGEHARHSNDTLTDAEAEWYLGKYPHIKSLFSELPKVKIADKPDNQPLRSKRKEFVQSILKSEKTPKNENLSATN